ncbi:MAG: ATP-binding protein [Candidatus Omnitrophota bacterium]
MRSLRIGPKLFFGFAICVSLSVMIGVIAMVNLSRIRTDTAQIRIVAEIEKEILECRRQEKNILLYGPHEKAAPENNEVEKTYLEKFNDSLVRLRKSIEEAQGLAEEEEEEEYIVGSAEIKRYEMFVREVVAGWEKREEMVQTVRVRGDALQAAIQRLAVNKSEALKRFLRARGQEKNYMLFQDEEYADKVKAEITALKKLTENEKIDKLADEYLISFNRFAEAARTIDADILNMRESARESARTVQKIAGEIMRVIVMRVDAAQKAAIEGTWIILVLLVVFGTWVSVFLSRRITDPVRKLAAATELIAKGDLTRRVDIKATDEIGELARSFNKMVEDLQKSRETLLSAKLYTDSLIANMIDTLIVVDPDGVIKTVNKATLDLLGYTEEELIGQPGGKVFAEEEEEEEEERFPKAIEKVIKDDVLTNYDLVYLTKSGEKIPVSFFGSAMRDKKGKLVGIVCIAHDMREIKRFIQKEKEFAAAAATVAAEKKRANELDQALKETLKSREIFVNMLDDNNEIREELERKLGELKQAQEQLIQSAKLASLGRLVSDMAHEVNNPLMVISGRAQLCIMKEKEKKKKEIKEDLKIIMDQCMRAKDVIQRLLLFSKPSVGEIKEFDINNVIEFVVQLLKHQYSLVNIEIIRKYSREMPPLKIDEKQMNEVFMNLLKNAADAMPDGGTITISTKREGDNIRVDIEDTGRGISEEDMKKIFDPFFTTREKGTGLGLSVCYGIIKAHDGELKYTSKLGKGTTATILLPIDGGVDTKD